MKIHFIWIDWVKVAKDFGGIEWIMNDIIGIAMDESLVDQQAKLLGL